MLSDPSLDSSQELRIGQIEVPIFLPSPSGQSDEQSLDLTMLSLGIDQDRTNGQIGIAR